MTGRQEMKIESGYPFYGQNVGILVFKQKTSRIAGDPGHNATFTFPVCYEVIEGGYAELINGSQKIEQALIEGALRLKARGIKAIVGDCGLMALYQNSIAEKTGLPVMASALSLMGLVWTAIGKSGSIGILTGHSDMLSERHLEAAGKTPEMKVVIQGMQEEPHFTQIVIEGKPGYIPEKMRIDVLNGARKLLKKSDDIRAIIVECSNLPTFSKDLYDEFGIPVFDIAQAANIMEACVNPKAFI